MIQTTTSDIVNVSTQAGETVTDVLNNLVVGPGGGGLDPADRAKLDSIQTGATANSTDAQLRDRSTHTGTQAASTVSDFAATARSVTAAQIVAGANMTITPSGDTLVLAAAGSSGGPPTGAAGGVLAGTYPNPTFAADMATQAELDAVAAAKVNTVAGKGLSTEDYTTAEKSKLAGIAAGAGVQAVASVAGKTGAVTLVKGDVGLGSVDNTADADKPVSTATSAALAGKEPTITAGTTSQFWLGNKTWADFKSSMSTLGGLTLASTLSTSGAFALTLTQTAATNVTLPTTGTLATRAGAETLTNKTMSFASNTVTVDGTNLVGYRNVPQTSSSLDYTLVLADAGKHILHPSADTTARTFTIPANASVAFVIGTVITFVNQNAAGAITIAITTDTMRLAGAGTTGSRTLAANGIATAIKVTATEWLISGVGLT